MLLRLIMTLAGKKLSMTGSDHDLTIPEKPL
jgi:hypothetical protein